MTSAIPVQRSNQLSQQANCDDMIFFPSKGIDFDVHSWTLTQYKICTKISTKINEQEGSE